MGPAGGRSTGTGPINTGPGAGGPAGSAGALRRGRFRVTDIAVAVVRRTWATGGRGARRWTGLERRRHLMPEPRAPAGTASGPGQQPPPRASQTGGQPRRVGLRLMPPDGAAPAGPSGARVRVGCLPAPGEHRFRAARNRVGISPPQPKQGKQSATGHHARRSGRRRCPGSPVTDAGVRG